MALSGPDVVSIALLGTPVLMLDTCSLLDVVREPMRPDCKLANVKAAMAMLLAAERGNKLIVLIAEQVSQEINDNLPDVQKGAENAMKEYIGKAQHVDLVAGAFGAVGAMNTAHLVDHVARARAVFDRWITVGIQVPPGPAVSEKAMNRVRRGIAPSRKGKENSKDCFVIESYLEVSAQLRATGFSAPIVFGSSNTKEYLDPVTKMPPAPLDHDLRQLGVDYASEHAKMMRMLGL